MAGAAYVMGIDQGTSSSRAILFDESGRPVASGAVPVASAYPQPGWVEQDPEAIWASVRHALRVCLERAGVAWRDVGAVGVANQRETVVLWERDTGRAVHPAISWQCRRTSPVCDRLRAEGVEPWVQARTGLVLDPYFSGPKIAWVLDQVPGLRRQAEAGRIAAGTIDSWLIARLTGGRCHVTDPSNASRTLLYNIHRHAWDAELLRLFKIPEAILPRLVPTCGVVGATDPTAVGGGAWPVGGVVGDQQASLFGQACHGRGMAKNTYGTGSFVLMNTGTAPVASQHGLLSTVAWQVGGQVTYALEGAVFIAGAALQWLRDAVGILDRVEDSALLAGSVPDTGGVYFVPAFAGLGAPYWDSHARGLLVGLTAGTGRAHIVRAALEAMAFQTRDVLDAMIQDSGQPLAAIRVDGGASRNAFLLQCQADVLGLPVARSAVEEATAWGAAALAGLAVGLWPDRETVAELWGEATVAQPTWTAAEREDRYRAWRRALDRARGWA
jgi:glycerol kinase